MKWILSTLVVIAAAAATVSGECKWAGKWQVLDLPAGDTNFAKWITCAGVTDQVRDVALKQKVEFEVAPAGDGKVLYTLRNPESGVTLTETFTPGNNEFKKTYFGVVVVTMNWENNEKGIVEIDIEGKKSTISFDPDSPDLVFNCGDIIAKRQIKKL